MRTYRRTALFLCAALLGLSCTPAETPKPPPGPPIADAFAAAFDAEAKDPFAAGPYLAAIDKAVANPSAKGALATVIASMDALVFGATSELELPPNHALAFRSRELMTEVVERLRKAWFDAGEHVGAPEMPFMRGFIAQGLHELAMYIGDEQPASVWVRRRGCVTEATLFGPLDSMGLMGIEGPSPVQSVGAPLAASLPGPPPFSASIKPIPVKAEACQLDVQTSSFLQGSRAVVVDLENPVAQRVSLAFTSTIAASVEVGGVQAIRRGFDAGGSPVTRLATVDLPAGRARVVMRVAQKSDGSDIELGAWDEAGLPLTTLAPKPGDVADAKARGAKAVEITPGGAGDAELALAAAGLLGLGEGRAAEHLLEAAEQLSSTDKGAAAGWSPRLDVLYARAIDAAEDIPSSKAVTRMRAAIERAMKGSPASWEARMLSARLTERQRGSGEGAAAALQEVGVSVAPPSAEGPSTTAPIVPASDALTLTYVALLASRTRLVDVAESAYAALAKAAPGSPLLAQVDARLHGRAGIEGSKAACEGGLSRASFDCLSALQGRGDYKASLSEIARLRRLRSSPEGLRDVEINVRLMMGDLPGALAAHDALAPAQQRLLDVLGFAAGKGMVEPVRDRLKLSASTARDAPYGMIPLIRALELEPDPAVALEAEGRQLVLKDMAQAFFPGGATAVLQHTERYSIEPTGLCRYLSYDLRRISGTTDVAQGGISYGPMIEGRNAPRLLRRRIHKRDGRILEPDSAANSAQWSDLSQLEQGDYVETIAEGASLPNDLGHFVLDTPDLLPERTSVRHAEIEVRRPANIPFSLWSHPMLGAAEERVDGSVKISKWRLKEALPRRIEDGVPRLERSVGISMGTQTWEYIGHALRENIRSLEEHDPYVARFAREVASEGGAAPPAPSRALVERVVTAVGKKVKLAGGGELSDASAMYGGGSQRMTARTILELGQGSRSWVIYRVLRELSVPVDLAIAETEPFSAAPGFPPHVGRFQHPLVIARLGSAGGDVWIDADVEGPPLPPGRINPELRGRSAMLTDGSIVAAPSTNGETGDEIDVRLKLDAKGDAEGSFTILLHGQPAQSLAEAFETVVGTERREMLRGVVLGWLPWADVEDVVVSSTEGSWEIALRASIKIHGYASPEGKDGKTWSLPGIEPIHLVFPRAFSGSLGATYASRGARESALSIDTALQYHLRRRIELPAGATVERAPGGVVVSEKSVQAVRKGSYGPVIEEDFSLSLPTGTVATDAYQSFVDKVRVIDDGFMSGTRVRVKP